MSITNVVHWTLASFKSEFPCILLLQQILVELLIPPDEVYISTRIWWTSDLHGTNFKSYAQYRDATETYMETNPKSYVE